MTLRGGAAPPGCPAAASPLRPAGRGREGPGLPGCPPLSAPVRPCPPLRLLSQALIGAPVQVLQGQEKRAHSPLSPLLGSGVGSSPLFRCWAALRAGIRLHQNSRKGKLNSNSLRQNTRGGETLTINVPRSASYAVVDRSHLWLGSSLPSKRGWPPRVLSRCGIHRTSGSAQCPPQTDTLDL